MHASLHALFLLSLHAPKKSFFRHLFMFVITQRLYFCFVALFVCWVGLLWPSRERCGGAVGEWYAADDTEAWRVTQRPFCLPPLKTSCLRDKKIENCRQPPSGF